MPFDVKDWQDDPSTPTDAAAFADLEARLSGYTEKIASSTPSVIEAFGHSLMPALAAAMARELKATVDDYSQGAAHLAMSESGVLVGAHYGGHGRTLKELDRRWQTDPNQYLYLAQSELAMIWGGLNDLPWLGPTNLAPVGHALRTMLSRIRSSIVYEETDSTVVRTGTWANDNIFVCAVASGGGISPAVANAGQAMYTSTGTSDSFQINVPSTFAGGRIALGFITNANGDGADWRIQIDGGALASWNTHQINGYDYGSTLAAKGRLLVSTYRTANLAPGAHTIVVTMVARAGNAYFDFWQVEPDAAIVENNLPLILVLGNPRPYSYTTYDPWPYDTAAGLSDADIDPLNAVIQGVVAEFDSRVVYIDTDSVLGKDPKYFKTDGLHLNPYGIGTVAELCLEAVSEYIDVLPRGFVGSSFERYYAKAAEGQSGGFLNSWVDFDTNTVGANTNAPMSWRRDPDGKMYVRGCVKSGSSATATVMNLETGRGFRPRHPVPFTIDGNGTQGLGRLETNGDLKFITGGSTTKTTFTFTYHGEV